MIRLRIVTDQDGFDLLDGIVYCEKGVPFGRVVIEHTKTGDAIDPEWEPVEVYAVIFDDHLNRH